MSEKVFGVAFSGEEMRAMNCFDYRSTSRRSALWLIAVAALTLCPVMAIARTIIPENPPPSESHQIGQFSLTVIGSFAGIDTEYFERAATDAIAASGLLSNTGNNGAQYVLEIRIIKVIAPSFSTKMKVSMNAVWELQSTAGNTVLLHKNIHSTYTGGAFEGGLIGANRVRAATEGAARENIRIGLEELASLNLGQGQESKVLTQN